MATQRSNYKASDRIINGISDYDKEAPPYSAAWIRSIDYRSDPRKIKILPRTVKESATVYQALPLWHEIIDNEVYIYDQSGNLYLRSSSGSHSLVRAVADSQGNGLCYYGEDGYLYYITNKSIGRYGQFFNDVGTKNYVDDFLGAEGGTPTNTNSVLFVAASSHSASAADHADNSVTGNISMFDWIKPTSLPTVGNSMTLQAKWTAQANQRSYKFDIYAISGYFGDGSDGALTVAADSTEAPIDSACTGTLDATTLSATHASFAAGQKILIHQTRGTGVGTWMRNSIASYTSGTITLDTPLNYAYTSGAQVRVLPQYSSVTIDSGKTYSVKAWNGTVGGILAFLCSGTLTVTGSISAAGSQGTAATTGASSGATGGGFRGGNSYHGSGSGQAKTGEGSAGASGDPTGRASGGVTYYDPNGSGGSANAYNNAQGGTGAGGGNGTAGSNSTGQAAGAYSTALGGIATGTADLLTMVFGGGGGGGTHDTGHTASSGSSGGGIVFASAATITVSGSITANGGASRSAETTVNGGSAGGAGAGGSILLKCQTATLGTSLITATGGAASNNSGAGGTGRVHIDYYTSYTGTTSPTLDANQDTTLVTNTTYSLRLMLSSNGTNEETLSKQINLESAKWQNVGVVWTASTKTAEFYFNGASVGTSVGTTVGAIYDSTSSYFVGAYKDSGGSMVSFYDGLVDENQLWSKVVTGSSILNNLYLERSGNESSLQAYHQFDAALTDGSGHSTNDLTFAAATYSTDVPFSAPTTRLDIDQTDTSTGGTFALATTINESNKQTFVPTKDPQKSISVNVSAKGTTSNWTLTVHDALNRIVATSTINNADLPTTGTVEFTMSDVWRPVMGATYHFHITAHDITGSPAVVTGAANTMETAQFTSYYQFLVETEFHMSKTFLNFMAVCNERYLAIWDASSYNPHRLTFPSGYTSRALGYWNEYLAIGCVVGNSLTNRDQGIIFFWDGISDTYNFYIPVPEGAINALFGTTGELHITAGYQGDQLIYTGGARAKKVKRVPKMTPDKEIEIYPGAITMWQSLVRIGVAGSCDSSDVERGVYSYGSLNEGYPHSLSYDYPISTGSRGSTVEIGFVGTINKKLLIGFKDNTGFGVDVVDPAGDVYPTATIEYNKSDNGGMWKEKAIHLVRVDHEPLDDGQTVTIKYRLDSSTDWITPETQSNDDDSVTRANIEMSRHRQYQVAVDLATTVSTGPVIFSTTVDEDDLADEDDA